MKALILYDSKFGNTERVAQAMGAALREVAAVETLHVDTVTPEQLAGVDLLVVGSPTQGFRPTKPVANLLRDLPRGSLRGVRVAAFDTRFAQSEIAKVRILAFLVRLFGFAAEKIATRLKRRGGDLVAPPEGFVVSGTEGPPADGELVRAAAWAKRLATQVSATMSVAT